MPTKVYPGALCPACTALRKKLGDAVRAGADRMEAFVALYPDGKTFGHKSWPNCSAACQAADRAMLKARAASRPASAPAPNDKSGFDRGQEYVNLWVRQRCYEFSFVYSPLEPWVKLPTLDSDEPAASKEMFAFFWVQTMFQGATDESNFDRLRHLLRKPGLRELRRTVLDPAWCMRNFDRGQCGNWWEMRSTLAFSKLKAPFLEVCGSCSARERCSVHRSVLFRNRTLRISVSPSVLTLRLETVLEPRSKRPPAIGVLSEVGNYDCLKHQLRGAVPAVGESVFGFLTDPTDPLISPLTARLAKWHVPTAGKFMETQVGKTDHPMNSHLAQVLARSGLCLAEIRAISPFLEACLLQLHRVRGSLRSCLGTQERWPFSGDGLSAASVAGVPESCMGRSLTARLERQALSATPGEYART